MGGPNARSWTQRIASGALAAMGAAVALAAPSAAGLELRASSALAPPTPLWPVAVTAGELPSVTVPPVSLPGVSVPTVTSPPASLPSVTVPPSLPSALPSLTVPPPVTVPPVSVPGVEVPSITIPPIGLPAVAVPPVTVPPTLVTPPHSPPSGARSPAPSVLAASELAGIGAAVGGLSFPAGAGKAGSAPAAGVASGATTARLALLRMAGRPLPVRLREAAADTAQQLSFPIGLALAIAAFLVVQRRMVGGDPRVSPEGVLRDDDLVGFS